MPEAEAAEVGKYSRTILGREEEKEEPGDDKPLDGIELRSPGEPGAAGGAQSGSEVEQTPEVEVGCMIAEVGEGLILAAPEDPALALGGKGTMLEHGVAGVDGTKMKVSWAWAEGLALPMASAQIQKERVYGWAVERSYMVRVSMQEEVQNRTVPDGRLTSAQILKGQASRMV
jgi:hypothetical protein